MLVLSRANSMEGCDGLPTIFDLMSSACTSTGAAETPTAGDAAYLKGLYAADLSQPASAAIGDVAQRRSARFSLAYLLPAALLTAQRAGADALPAKPQAPMAEISVVAARPATAAEIAGDNIATFVRSHGKPGKRIDQLGRWEKAPCAATVGLSPAFNEYVTTRIQAIENAVHIPQQAAQPCKTNALIVFTTKPQAFLDDVAKNKPHWLGFHYMAEVAKLKAVQRPVQSWYATATRSTSFENNFQKATAGPEPEQTQLADGCGPASWT
jgi:hypothetical protein